ncbi:hypothetical protein EDD17DRAFT_1514278 [Pisolithus thermaeus]|nr:hypothetical protein EV401DRAFT_1887032 [Pisolithus croceorrhizus]KAI6148209.1 hypothetical protein EDD17DRAFT_1514278 [Pisolithus thermaeus]
MSAILNPPSEFKKKLQQALDEIDFYATSAPAGLMPNQDMKHWLQGWNSSLSKAKSKANKNIQAGQSAENPSGPAQDSGAPEVFGSTKAKGNRIPQDAETIIDRCERCMSKWLSCAGVKGQACP